MFVILKKHEIIMRHSICNRNNFITCSLLITRNNIVSGILY